MVVFSIVARYFDINTILFSHYFFHQYSLHRAEIIDELVALITTEPPADLAENVRFKFSNIACEILTSEVPVLIERLVSSRSTLEKLYAFWNKIHR